MKKLVFSMLTMSVLQIGSTFAQCLGIISINGRSVVLDTSSFSPGSAHSSAAAGLAALRCGQFVQGLASSPSLLSGLIAQGKINATDALKACQSSAPLSGGWRFQNSHHIGSRKLIYFSTTLNRGNCPGATSGGATSGGTTTGGTTTGGTTSGGTTTGGRPTGGTTSGGTTSGGATSGGATSGGTTGGTTSRGLQPALQTDPAKASITSCTQLQSYLGLNDPYACNVWHVV